MRNAQIYRLMANPKRLEILNILRKRELAVTELTVVTGMTKANLSQHLRLLREWRLVKVRRQGKHSYYTVVHADIVKPCRILNHVLTTS